MNYGIPYEISVYIPIHVVNIIYKNQYSSPGVVM